MDREEVKKIIEYEKLSNEELSELIWMADAHLYKERPVTINEFIDSDDFVHKKWPKIYPIWRDLLNKIYPTPFNAPYNEILLSAAAGAGKTVSATIGNIYDMYKLGCLKDPCAFYNLSPDTMLIFAIFSATGSTAAVNWNDLTTAIESCPWMNEKVVDRRGLEKKYGSLVPVEILPGIFIQTGSKFQHSMGKAIFDGLMDEAAFGGDNLKEAQKTYNELSSRMATRFRSYSKDGNLPGHLFLISSPKDAGDFMQYRIEKATQAQSKHTLIKQNISSWDANPANDSEDKFIVFVGNQFKEPKIYDENEEPDIEDIDYIIYPPTSYKEEFKKDLLGSIMNYGGITTIADTSLFKSPTYVNDAMVLTNPFKQNVIQLPFSNSEAQLMDYIDLDYFKSIRHPEYNRFIHIDAAFSSNTNDRYGLAATYCILNDTNIITQFNNGIISDEIFSKMERTYYVDWAIGIEPMPGQEISLSKVQDFIFYLMKKLNYPVACISADTFNSKQTLQNFEQEGYTTTNISLDRTRDPYLFFRQLVYKKQVLMPKHDDLKMELIKLRDNGKKIDHTINNCFTADTKIQLVDGRTLSIAELLIEQTYKTNWVYTYNEETQLIEPKPIKKVFQSKLTTELVEVTLDNNEKIYCTPEHKFMLRNGEYAEIQNLSPQTSLMPLYTKVAEKGLKGYRLLYQPMLNKWVYEHRNFVKCQKNKGDIIHHCNFNKLDNTLSNLKVMTKSQHCSIHNNIRKDYDIVSQKVTLYHATHKNTEAYYNRNKKLSESMQNYNLSKGKPKVIKINGTRYIESRVKEIEKYFNVDYTKLNKKERSYYSIKYTRLLNPEIQKRIGKKVSEHHKAGKFKNAIKALKDRVWYTNGKDNIYIKSDQPVPEGYYRGRTISEETKLKQKLAAQRMSPEKKAEARRKRQLAASSKRWITNGDINKYIDKHTVVPEGFYYGRTVKLKNHKIKSIKLIHKPCKVYDLEVEDNHNFALAAGVIVHNSKDVSDAVAGSIWSCANSKNIMSLTKLSSMTLNPFATPNQYNSYSEQELKSLELAEFDRLRSQYSNGIFKNL